MSWESWDDTALVRFGGSDWIATGMGIAVVAGDTSIFRWEGLPGDCMVVPPEHPLRAVEEAAAEWLNVVAIRDVGELVVLGGEQMLCQWVYSRSGVPFVVRLAGHESEMHVARTMPTLPDALETTGGAPSLAMRRFRPRQGSSALVAFLSLCSGTELLSGASVSLSVPCVAVDYEVVCSYLEYDASGEFAWGTEVASVEKAVERALSARFLVYGFRNVDVAVR